jgi:hypothetical protein
MWSTPTIRRQENKVGARKMITMMMAINQANFAATRGHLLHLPSRRGPPLPSGPRTPPGRRPGFTTKLARLSRAAIR